MLRIFRHYVSAFAVLFMVLELLLFLIVNTVVLSTSEHYGFPSGLKGSDPYLFSILYSVIEVSFIWSVGLYRPDSMARPRAIIVRTFVVLALSLPLFPTLFLLVSRSVRTTVSYAFVVDMTLSLLISWAIATGLRILAMGIFQQMHVRRKLLIVGAGERAMRVIDLVKSKPWSYIDFVGCLDVRGEFDERAWKHGEIRVLRSSSVAEAMRETGAVEILVAVQDRRGIPLSDLLEYRMRGYHVVDYLSFWEREFGSILVDELNPAWLIYSDGFRLSFVINEIFKRLGDIIVSIAFLVITIPILLTTVVVVACESRGPVIFRQERVGRGGRPFILYKFRSMRLDSEAAGPRWAGENDPRITSFGRFIRRTRIDELPQLLNVLKGDMSFIGPRPEQPHFVRLLADEIPFYNERHRIRPGITGWAQINYPYGASVEDAKHKLSFDLYYIKNYSLLLDVIVLFETVEVILWPKGVR